MGRLRRSRRRRCGALGDVAGLDVVELGCGTAYFSAWLARRGARPVGVDVTPAQLDTARRMQEETGLVFPLVEANAEDVPLPDASFDLAVSEYGASLWCDPARWIPEAARLLRPGGRLVFLTNSMLATLCVAVGPGPCDREPPAAAARDVRRSSGDSRTVWSSTWATASGSTSSARRGIRGRAPRRAVRARRCHGPPVLRHRERRRGRASGRVRDLWVARKTG